VVLLEELGVVLELGEVEFMLPEVLVLELGVVVELLLGVAVLEGVDVSVAAGVVL
jgi:hypothetical protein